jgi:hypothetical protein
MADAKLMGCVAALVGNRAAGGHQLATRRVKSQGRSMALAQPAQTGNAYAQNWIAGCAQDQN